jgi:hypothetical protein
VEPDADLTPFEAELRLDPIRRAQAGLVADLDRVADAVYGRGEETTRRTP